jgi:hypothetical protein
MKPTPAIFVLFLTGCSSNAENKKNFEACVQQAELKYSIAFDEICIQEPWSKPGKCSYNIESNNALIRSKDNEITACAAMYAPNKAC